MLARSWTKHNGFDMKLVIFAMLKIRWLPNPLIFFNFVKCESASFHTLFWMALPVFHQQRKRPYLPLTRPLCFGLIVDLCQCQQRNFSACPLEALLFVASGGRSGEEHQGFSTPPCQLCRSNPPRASPGPVVCARTELLAWPSSQAYWCPLRAPQCLSITRLLYVLHI